MNGHAPIGADALTRDEALALSGYEETIERGMTTFIEVGTALAQIHEQRLYRAQFATFEEYCAERWNFTGRRGRQLIDAAAIGTVVPVANEGQARALSVVPEAERAEVFAQASERTGGKPTAKVITEVAEERTAPSTADVVAAVLAKLPADGDGITILRLVKLIPGTRAAGIREVLGELVESGEAERIPGAGGQADHYRLPSPEPDITADVLRVLADFGAHGATAWQVAFNVDNANHGEQRVAYVNVVLNRLADEQQVQIVGAADGGALWALTGPTDGEDPEPDPTSPGSDPADSEEDSAEVPTATAPPAAFTPEQRRQIAEEGERRQAINNAHKKADRLLSEVSGFITEIEAGIAYGEPGLVTAEMVAGLRAQADRLEKWMEKQA